MKDITESIKQIDKMIYNYEQQIELCKELKASIAQQANSEANDDKVVQFSMTRDQYTAFKVEYEQARRFDKDQFSFLGIVFVTSYTKYLIEYWDSL